MSLTDTAHNYMSLTDTAAAEPCPTAAHVGAAIQHAVSDITNATDRHTI